MANIYSMVVNDDVEGLKKIPSALINGQLEEMKLVSVAVEANSEDCLYHLLDVVKGGAPQIFSLVTTGEISPIRLAINAGNTKCLQTILHIVDDEYISQIVEKELMSWEDVSVTRTTEECLEVVMKRIDESRDYDLLTSFFIYALPMIIERDYRAALELSMKMLADLNDREPEVVDDILYVQNSAGDTILHQAVKGGNLAVVKTILSIHSDLLKMKNTMGYTPVEMESTPLIKNYLQTVSMGYTQMVQEK